MNQNINWDSLASIAWGSLSSTADWAAMLNGLLGLAASADSGDKSNQLADRLDEFADKANSDDLQAISKLCDAAGKAARALRSADMTQRVQELAAANSVYQEAAGTIAAATTGLTQEASLLRAEKFTATVNALTQTISSLTTLSKVARDDNNATLVAAINDALASAQKLHDLIKT
jgi:hypothetical protein